MKLLIEWVKSSKSCLKTLSVFTEKGPPFGKIGTNMAGRVNEDVSESPPNKKLCIDVKNVSESAPNKKLCIDVKNGETESKEKVRNKKVALLLAYLGDDYCGLQVNSSVKTVEGELLSALKKAVVIKQEVELHSIHFQRTARTDKGVSAAKQVISLKMAENYCIDTINKYLPEDIKLHSAKKVTKGFNCKNDCTARTYSYTLPTFALAPEIHLEYPQKYRINEETMQKASEILQSYKGTHNFHNFTVKKDFRDPSAHRYMMHVDMEKPFLHGEEEFITVKIKGQSFMFHQIRKMIGHMIAILKGAAPKDIQNDVWNNVKYSVPLAPGLGLVLEDVHFEKYNRKFGNDGIHESLNWDEIADEVKSFRSYILSSILTKETERKSMFNWIQGLVSHNYDREKRQFIQNVERVEGTGEEKIPDEKILTTGVQ